MKLVHSERSLYRDVMVYEYDGQRCICFMRECRVGRQSCYYLADSVEVRHELHADGAGGRAVR